MKPFRSLLVAVDLTPNSDRVLGRVALLPLSDDARVTLIHVVPGSLPLRDRRRAESDARAVLAAEIRRLYEALPHTVRVEAIVKAGAASKEIAACARAARAEVIVMGRGGRRALRDVFLGSTAERVIRQSRRPVLVVRLPPRAPYARPAVALDLDQAAQESVVTTLRVIQRPRPRVDVIHAFDYPYESVVYPSLSEDGVDERQHYLKLQASRELSKLLTMSLERAKVPPSEAPRWKTFVQHGSPRAVITKTIKKAGTDLLVLGTHGYSGVAHLFLGTVAGDVLREVACDVLVAPPASPKS